MVDMNRFDSRFVDPQKFGFTAACLDTNVSGESKNKIDVQEIMPQLGLLFYTLQGAYPQELKVLLEQCTDDAALLLVQKIITDGADDYKDRLARAIALLTVQQESLLPQTVAEVRVLVGVPAKSQEDLVRDVFSGIISPAQATYIGLAAGTLADTLNLAGIRSLFSPAVLSAIDAAAVVPAITGGVLVPQRVLGTTDFSTVVDQVVVTSPQVFERPVSTKSIAVPIGYQTYKSGGILFKTLAEARKKVTFSIPEDEVKKIIWQAIGSALLENCTIDVISLVSLIGTNGKTWVGDSDNRFLAMARAEKIATLITDLLKEKAADLKKLGIQTIKVRSAGGIQTYNLAAKRGNTGMQIDKYQQAAAESAFISDVAVDQIPGVTYTMVMPNEDINKKNAFGLSDTESLARESGGFRGAIIQLKTSGAFEAGFEDVTLPELGTTLGRLSYDSNGQCFFRPVNSKTDIALVFDAQGKAVVPPLVHGDKKISVVVLKNKPGNDFTQFSISATFVRSVAQQKTTIVPTTFSQISFELMYFQQAVQNIFDLLRSNRRSEAQTAFEQLTARTLAELKAQDELGYEAGALRAVARINAALQALSEALQGTIVNTTEQLPPAETRVTAEFKKQELAVIENKIRNLAATATPKTLAANRQELAKLKAAYEKIAADYQTLQRNGKDTVRTNAKPESVVVTTQENVSREYVYPVLTDVATNTETEKRQRLQYVATVNKTQQREVARIETIVFNPGNIEAMLGKTVALLDMLGQVDSERVALVQEGDKVTRAITDNLIEIGDATELPDAGVELSPAADAQTKQYVQIAQQTLQSATQQFTAVDAKATNDQPFDDTVRTTMQRLLRDISLIPQGTIQTTFTGHQQEIAEAVIACLEQITAGTTQEDVDARVQDMRKLMALDESYARVAQNILDAYVILLDTPLLLSAARQLETLSRPTETYEQQLNAYRNRLNAAGPAEIDPVLRQQVSSLPELAQAVTTYRQLKAKIPESRTMPSRNDYTQAIDACAESYRQIQKLLQDVFMRQPHIPKKQQRSVGYTAPSSPRNFQYIQVAYIPATYVAQAFDTDGKNNNAAEKLQKTVTGEQQAVLDAYFTYMQEALFAQAVADYASYVPSKPVLSVRKPLADSLTPVVENIIAGIDLSSRKAAAEFSTACAERVKNFPGCRDTAQPLALPAEQAKAILLEIKRRLTDEIIPQYYKDKAAFENKESSFLIASSALDQPETHNELRVAKTAEELMLMRYKEMLAELRSYAQNTADKARIETLVRLYEKAFIPEKVFAEPAIVEFKLGAGIEKQAEVLEENMPDTKLPLNASWTVLFANGASLNMFAETKLPPANNGLDYILRDNTLKADFSAPLPVNKNFLFTAGLDFRTFNSGYSRQKVLSQVKDVIIDSAEGVITTDVSVSVPINIDVNVVGGIPVVTTTDVNVPISVDLGSGLSLGSSVSTLFLSVAAFDPAYTVVMRTIRTDSLGNATTLADQMLTAAGGSYVVPAMADGDSINVQFLLYKGGASVYSPLIRNLTINYTYDMLDGAKYTLNADPVLPAPIDRQAITSTGSAVSVTVPAFNPAYTIVAQSVLRNGSGTVISTPADQNFTSAGGTYTLPAMAVGNELTVTFLLYKNGSPTVEPRICTATIVREPDNPAEVYTVSSKQTFTPKDTQTQTQTVTESFSGAQSIEKDVLRSDYTRSLAFNTSLIYRTLFHVTEKSLLTWHSEVGISTGYTQVIGYTELANGFSAVSPFSGKTYTVTKNVKNKTLSLAEDDKHLLTFAIDNVDAIDSLSTVLSEATREWLKQLIKGSGIQDKLHFTSDKQPAAFFLALSATVGAQLTTRFNEHLETNLGLEVSFPPINNEKLFNSPIYKAAAGFNLLGLSPWLSKIGLNANYAYNAEAVMLKHTLGFGLPVQIDFNRNALKINNTLDYVLPSEESDGQLKYGLDIVYVLNRSWNFGLKYNHTAEYNDIPAVDTAMFTVGYRF